MPIEAKDAVIGVVYLTPKGRALERIARAADADPEDDTVPFRRLDDGSTFGVAPDYALTPKPIEVAPSRVDALKGLRIDDVIAAVVGSVEPFAGAPLTDDELEELLASDTRGRVQRALAEEGAKRAAGGRPVPAEVKPAEMAEAPPSGKGEWCDGVLVVAQGVGDVEEIPFAPESLLWWWHAESEGYVLLTRSQVAASGDAGLLVEVGDDAAKAADESARAKANEVADGGSAESSAASDSSLPASRDGDAVATAPTDDLPWPASTPPVAEPVAVQADGATTATEAPSAPVEAPAPADAPKPEKTRPRGWCPACRQFLTVRADGTMMQHFTPDGAKGPDGKRIDCQGVGLTPAAERPPEPRLPLPVAMGVEAPAAPIIERPVLAMDGATSRALDAIREHDADTPPAAVHVRTEVDADPDRVMAALADGVDRIRASSASSVRYVRAGGTSYGYTIVDLVPNEPMRREDGAVAVWEREEDADAALVYVREHGELPTDVDRDDVPDTDNARAIRGELPNDPSADAEPFPSPSRRWTAFLHDTLPPAPTVVNNAPTTAQACDAIDTLTRHVEAAKARGVRVRIVIEPIE